MKYIFLFLFLTFSAQAATEMGNEAYPANYVPSCSICTYLIVDQNGSGNDASVVFRDGGNARAEVGLIGDDNLHFKTVSGTYNTESFSDRLIILGTGSANPGNVGIGTTNPAALFSVGTNSDITMDYVGNLITDSTIQVVNVAGNAVMTISGEKTSGTGEGLRLRNPTDGTVGYFADDSWLNGGTAYHQIDVQAAQTDGILCLSGGGNSACALSVGTTNISNFTSAPTINGVAMGVSGQGAEQMLSFQPGLITTITNTKGVYGKIVKTSTVDNIIGSATAFTTCTTNPTVTMYECGTSVTCATPTTIGSTTVAALGTAYPGSISSPTITAGDYVAFAISAGACASLDIGATAQIHAN